jgi:hypothetical protein
MGQAMHVEHIDPNGGDKTDNLALSCPNCNQSKAKATHAIDPDTGKGVSLFHPRQQIWSEHFVWIENGEQLKGLTSIGRATIERLKINQDRVVTARRLWIRIGIHPPTSLVEKG